MGSPKPAGSRVWQAALYTRLSREDGDKLESNSIANQRAILEEVIARDPTLSLAQVYVDDGCTGTHFHRPGFQQMLRDIEAGQIDCVMVKDLSRFGRDYLDTGHYLERWLPEHGVRFIAVGDGIDSAKGAYDMLLPFKNVFNEQYARDISKKVRSAFRAKQERGQFIGAFPSYGYRKCPSDHNKLEIDPVAAQVVRRVFGLFEAGMGKVSIAKTLNAEGIPCPSEYKKRNGDRYHNGQRIDRTTYWTYSTIHRMLQNTLYTGTMEQGRAPRAGMHGKATKLDPSQWVVVPATHEAIIPPDQWERVQRLLQKKARQLTFRQEVSPFAGFLTCGDCGRAMCKTRSGGNLRYGCGSYKRYGPTVCSPHTVSHDQLCAVVLADLNRVLTAVPDLKALTADAIPPAPKRDLSGERSRIGASLDRLYHLKKAAYEDYREGLLAKEDYLRYKADYEAQEDHLSKQLAALDQVRPTSPLDTPWIKALLRHGKLTELDRATVAETIAQIRIFEGNRMEITYRFSDDFHLFPETPPPNT